MNRLLFVILLTLFVSSGWSIKPDPGTEAQLKAGKELYMQKCNQCHGDEGDGQGPGAKNLNPPPRDFTMAIYKIKTTPNGMLATNKDLFDIIRKGIPYTSMPGWPQFSDEEVTNLVYYIKSFSEDYMDEELLAEPIEIPEIPEPTKESLKNGLKFFEENKCMDCHGKYGRADGPSGPDLEDSHENPMRAADLTKRWTWRGGTSKKHIYRTLMTGIEGTPMPSIVDNFQNDQEKWDIVNYVYSLGKDEPEYSMVLVAKGLESEINVKDYELFNNCKPAHFPLMGQIVEPGRRFNSSINSIVACAVYNADDIAIQLTWHDMAAEKGGSNSPDLEVPLLTPNLEKLEDSISDAVAIQVPSKKSKTIAKPYFIFGDKKNSVDLWFADLAKSKAQLFMGKGSRNLKKMDSDLEFNSKFEDGRWTAIFKTKRKKEKGLSFKTDAFVPISFSIWNGMRFERGNKRTLSRWYDLYLEPMDLPSPIYPAIKTFLIVFLLEIFIIGAFRISKKN